MQDKYLHIHSDIVAEWLINKGFEISKTVIENGDPLFLFEITPELIDVVNKLMEGPYA